MLPKISAFALYFAAYSSVGFFYYVVFEPTIDFYFKNSKSKMNKLRCCHPWIQMRGKIEKSKEKQEKKLVAYIWKIHRKIFWMSF
jgi:hypothetical protein